MALAWKPDSVWGIRERNTLCRTTSGSTNGWGYHWSFSVCASDRSCLAGISRLGFEGLRGDTLPETAHNSGRYFQNRKEDRQGGYLPCLGVRS